MPYCTIKEAWGENFTNPKISSPPTDSETENESSDDDTELYYPQQSNYNKNDKYDHLDSLVPNKYKNYQKKESNFRGLLDKNTQNVLKQYLESNQYSYSHR